MGIFLSVYVSYAIPLVASIILGWSIYRKRVDIQRWDLLLLIAPILFWSLLILLPGISMSPKTFSNSFVEPFTLGWVAGVGFILRCWLSNYNQKQLSFALFTTIMSFAFLFVLFFPTVQL